MSRLTNKEIQIELMETNINIYSITPSSIIKDYSVEDFATLINEWPYSINYAIRLKILERLFVENENFEYAVPVRDLLKAHK